MPLTKRGQKRRGLKSRSEDRPGSPSFATNKRRIAMNRRMAPGVFLITCLGLVLSMTPLQAEADHCSTAAQAGNWAYTYTGTIFTPSGPLLPWVILARTRQATSQAAR